VFAMLDQHFGKRIKTDFTVNKRTKRGGEEGEDREEGKTKRTTRN
jgi:hypothetical protein